MFKLTLTCQDCHAEQFIFLDSSFGEEWAREYGKIMDGTSAMFVNGPVTDSETIGRCQICKGRFTTDVTDIGEAVVIRNG